jgi:4-hydroxy-2-oxoheptanedioate aldolase
MTLNKLAHGWARGEAVLGAWVTDASEAAVGVLTRAGYDYIGIDCQHSLISAREAGRLIAPLIHIPLATLVRVGRNAPGPIAQMLDAGADGVIVPMVHTAQEGPSPTRLHLFTYRPVGM